MNFLKRSTSLSSTREQRFEQMIESIRYNTVPFNERPKDKPKVMMLPPYVFELVEEGILALNISEEDQGASVFPNEDMTPRQVALVHRFLNEFSMYGFEGGSVTVHRTDNDYIDHQF